jgi:hypothetical protein
MQAPRLYADIRRWHLQETMAERRGTANQRRKQKQQYRRQYIAQGGVLQTQQGQFLIDNRDNADQQASQGGEAVARQRAPKTCSKYGLQGHTIRTCPDIQRNS